MFYRIKFDGTISEILNELGYTTTSQKVNIWPAGLSASLIKQSKQMGLNAETAACLGFAKYISNELGIENAVKAMHVDAALKVALKKQNIDLSVIDKLQDIVNSLRDS